ncbi:M28 family metallopeptidase [Polyangium mundeleinium]|uniref:M20/M25/M40 family metallo-hydrolase n=1 Tax=Polyangium mundeleinium TaxID=2995306 RepID=A0ABT5EUP2_9BACT|nr:M20/M25/M40 family metallo-hydrolase [Polyangium mundeleinium]MDC0744476.1 M20/M25/M40 family metallo-hydrolase [Polyangium mundeleinium]
MPRLPLALAFVLASCGTPAAPPAAPPAPPAASTPPAPAPPPIQPACAVAADFPPLLPPRLDLRAPEPSRGNLRAWVDLLADPALHGRAAGSADNRRVADLLARAFLSFGFSPPEGHDPCVPFERDGVRDQNVIAHLRGKTPPDGPVVLVGAHYDAQGERDGEVYPGADDNASGVAALLEIARVHALRGSDLDLVVVAFGAEERGVLGAEAFVEAPTVPLARLALMVNLDMVGRPLLDGSPLRLVVPRAAEALGFVVGARDGEKTRALLDRAAAREDRPLFGIPEAAFRRLGYASDSVPFGPHTPTIFLSDAALADYHQPTDTPDQIDLDQIGRAARLALTLVDEVQKERRE